MSIRSENLVRVREQIPFTGKGAEALLGFLRKILSDNPLTQEFTCRIGQPIDIVKLVPEGEAPPVLLLHDAVRAQKMEELSREGDPFKTLWAMFSTVEEEGLEVSHILVGSKFSFQDWLGVRLSHKSMRCFGVPVVPMPEIPSDTFLVVGSIKRDAEPEDIRFSVKGALP